jgi:hypothetical protein
MLSPSLRLMTAERFLYGLIQSSRLNPIACSQARKPYFLARLNSSSTARLIYCPVVLGIF